MPCRTASRTSCVNIAVSQDANPQVYASDGAGNTYVLDAQTLQKIAQHGQFRRRHSLYGWALMAAMMHELLAAASVAGRICVGLVFLLAAAQKAQHWRILPGVIANYRLLPRWMAVAPVAALLPPAEMVLAILLLSAQLLALAGAGGDGAAGCCSPPPWRSTSSAGACRH